MDSRAYAPRLASALALAFALAACTGYEAPAGATIDGMTDGLLDSRSPNVVVRFDRPVRWETLRLEIVPFTVDERGNLADEAPGAEEQEIRLSPLLSFDGPTDTRGAVFTPSADGLTLTIAPKAKLPVGPKLALLVYPGLTTTDGVKLTYRRRLPFAYKFECTGKTGPGELPSGAYFWLLNVEKPTATQVKLFGRLRIDETTGRFEGIFTNAARNRDASRCTPACATTEACQTIPSNACVAPSLRANAAEEWPDFLPNAAPPTGFTLNIKGCAERMDDGTVALATVPAELAVEQPPVRVQALVVSAAFRKVGDAWIASGGITGDNVIFGSTGLGPGQGTVLSSTVPAATALPGLAPLEEVPKP
jgi:hypothetical protein